MNTSSFKAKLRKIGNSLGVIIPANVITYYKEGDEIELNVITMSDKPVKKPQNVITSEVKNKSNVITSKRGKMTFNIKKGIWE